MTIETILQAGKDPFTYDELEAAWDQLIAQIPEFARRLQERASDQREQANQLRAAARADNQLAELLIAYESPPPTLLSS